MCLINLNLLADTFKLNTQRTYSHFFTIYIRVRFVQRK